ncbi:MAG: hypothetical protein L0K70_02195, partial [Bifidobacterium crudilactis]|nr:hypothetical protein [Bifidobacterium crudilactis]
MAKIVRLLSLGKEFATGPLVRPVVSTAWASAAFEDVRPDKVRGPVPMLAAFGDAVALDDGVWLSEPASP